MDTNKKWCCTLAWVGRALCGLIFVTIALQTSRRLDSHQEHVAAAERTWPNLSSLLAEDCQCRSLFSIAACAQFEHISETKYPGGRRALANVWISKHRNSVLIREHLHVLARFLPNVRNMFNKEKGSSKIILDETNLPYVPCEIHTYTERQSLSCLNKRFYILKKPLIIAFLGDSKVRNLMEQMINHLGESIEFKIIDRTRQIKLKEEFIGHRIKHDVTFLGTTLQLQFFWRISLSVALKTLLSWTTNDLRHMTQKPDIVFFDDGNWAMLQNDELTGIRNVLEDFKLSTDIFKSLSATTALLWRSPTPIKEWVVSEILLLNVFSNQGLDYVAKLGWLKLNNSGVVLWDTSTPVYLKERDQCQAFLKSWRLDDLPSSWNCNDRGHFSEEANAVAGNMLWNLICNKAMNRSSSFCCS